MSKVVRERGSEAGKKAPQTLSDAFDQLLK